MPGYRTESAKAKEHSLLLCSSVSHMDPPTTVADATDQSQKAKARPKREPEPEPELEPGQGLSTLRQHTFPVVRGPPLTSRIHAAHPHPLYPASLSRWAPVPTWPLSAPQGSSAVLRYVPSHLHLLRLWPYRATVPQPAAAPLQRTFPYLQDPTRAKSPKPSAARHVKHHAHARAVYICPRPPTSIPNISPLTSGPISSSGLLCLVSYVK